MTKMEPPDLGDALMTGGADSGGVDEGHSRKQNGDAFEMLFQANAQPMWIYDRETLRFLAVNDAAVAIYGYTREEFLAMTLADIRPAEDVPRLKQRIAGPPRPGYQVSTGWRHVRKDGRCIHVTIHSHEIAYRNHDAALIMAADVTELYETIAQLEAQTAYFRQLFANSPEGVVLLGHDGKILEANETFQRMFGYTLDELLGRTPLSLIVPEGDTQDSLNAFARNVQAHEPARLMTVRQHKDGTLLDVEILAYPVQTKNQALGVFAIYQDVTERQRRLSEIEYQARHDMLTGLLNRTELTRRLHAALQAARRHGTPYAFLYIDLDQFKVINDTCGHTAGDRVLVELSQRLKSAVRETDVVARLGGDEFGVLLAKCNPEKAAQRAQTLLQIIDDHQFAWQARSFPLAASIGLVDIGPDTATVEQVLSAADAACYAAKEKGRNRIQQYSPHDADFVSRKNEMVWVSRLNTAIEQNRFVLFHQEIRGLNAGARAVRHREILVRYRDHEDNLVPPGAFIPSAERYNLMPAIDRWVLQHVCQHAQQKKNGTSNGDVLAINVSGTTLSDESFPDFVKETLAETRLGATSLCFEITETAAISNLALASRFIDEMKALGCRIALDDFGSGMSSFNYLRKLPVDYLKIDGMFVRDMVTNPVDCAMTEAINNVGKVLGLETIAEFVENDATLKRLQAFGVDYAQGYGVHIPEPWL